MTTNVVRKPLIDYTAAQCRLLGIPLSRVSSGFFWDSATRNWRQDYVQLPVVQNKKIILVPKYAVRYVVGVDAEEYRAASFLSTYKLSTYAQMMLL